MKVLFFLLALVLACQAYSVDRVDKDELIREIQNEIDNDEGLQQALENNDDLEDSEENETEANDPKPFRFRRAIRRIRIRGRSVWRRIGKPAVCAYYPHLCPLVRG